MIILENDRLLVSVNPFGSELTRLFDKKDSKEVLYDGKGEWDHSDHVLFPIIGDNRSFTIAGHSCFIPTTHGFARTSSFEVASQGKDAVTLTLTHNADEAYPLDCQIVVKTYLEGNKLIRESRISSLSGVEISYQYGLHPAFRASFGLSSLNVSEGTELLELEKGIIKRKYPFPHCSSWLIDRHYIEERDTLVLSNPNGRISLDNGQGKKITLLSNCPYFAVWSPGKSCKNDFICLESWYGLSPYIGMKAELGERESAQKTKLTATYRDELVID